MRFSFNSGKTTFCHRNSEVCWSTKLATERYGGGRMTPNFRDTSATIEFSHRNLLWQFKGRLQDKVLMRAWW